MKDFTKEKGVEQIFEQEVALPQVEVKRKIFGEADIIYKERELEISTVPMEKEACVCCEITKDEISRVGVIMEGPQKPKRGIQMSLREAFLTNPTIQKYQLLPPTISPAPFTFSL